MDVSTTEPRDFISYPTNRVVGTVADAVSARAALEDLLQAGFAREDVEVLRGDDGEHRLDPSGDAHGWLAQLQRTLIRVAAPAEEHRHLMRHLDDVRAGRSVVMVLAKERASRETAVDILNAHGATFIGFYGRWAWQGFVPVPEVSSPDVEATAGDQPGPRGPDTFPSRFAAAWNERDPGGLAALFDEDAAFVNADGLWWHGRASIRSAFADAAAHPFAESSLTVAEVTVKRLAADIAVVHASMTVSTPASTGSVDPGRFRTTIFCYVVRRTATGWLCASAQNTAVAPTATDGREPHLRRE